MRYTFNVMKRYVTLKKRSIAQNPAQIHLHIHIIKVIIRHITFGNVIDKK